LSHFGPPDACRRSLRFLCPESHALSHTHPIVVGCTERDLNGEPVMSQLSDALLDGTVVLVSGGTQGLGAAVATAAVRNGR
jgi:hypothetical protein